MTIVFIPENLDLDKILLEHPPQYTIENDKMLLLLGQIAEHTGKTGHIDHIKFK
jgi:hypothetical protein